MTATGSGDGVTPIRPRRLSYRLWVVIACLLSLPLIAMGFTSEVRWDASDFAAAAVLLIGAGVVHEAAMRFVRGTAARMMVGGVLFVLVTLVWLQGAVGLV